MSAAAATAAEPVALAGGGRWRVHLAALIVTLAAVAVGPITVPLGGFKLLLLPLLYAFVAAALLNPAISPVARPWMRPEQVAIAGACLLPAFYPFIAALGLLIGQEIATVARAGLALALQEIGHLGAILVGVPISVYLLRLRREAVGATFSIGREASLAIVSERYGMKSAEGAGLIAIYVTGTLLGTLFFSLFTAAILTAELFDPRALAMACGLGSASMTAACIGSITAALPARTAELGALAAASNLASTATGLYFSLFIALPLTERLYRLLGKEEARSADEVEVAAHHAPAPPQRTFVAAIAAMALAMSIGLSAVSKGGPLGPILLAVACLGAAIGGGLLLGRLVPLKVPDLCWISLVAMVLALPGMPTAPLFAGAMKAIDPGAMAAIGVAYAAFALTREEVGIFRRTGIRLVLLALLVFAGSFLGSAVIAQAALALQGGGIG